MASRKPFLLRIDPELWADLELWARDELRSVNGQIEYLLRQAVLKRKGAKPEARNPNPKTNPNPASDISSKS
jgi:hypothetical protein